MNFNKEQLEAIKHNKGACAVIASAGSGKSTVLVHRVDNLINKCGVQPEDIQVISFTRKTVEDLVKKLSRMGYDGVSVNTFHSLSARIISNSGYDINRLPVFYKIENLFKYGYRHGKVDTKHILSFISFQKVRKIGYNDEFAEYESDYTDSELREWYKLYEEYKTREQLLDLDDWLFEANKILKSERGQAFRKEYVLVDENQDSNSIQNDILSNLVKKDNVFIVGDYRQAIYGFNGAVPEEFMDADKRWDGLKVINMGTNYRSRKNIVEKSNDFISEYYGNYRHYHDAIPFIQENGFIGVYTHIAKENEAIFVADKIKELLEKGDKPRSIAVLYRNNIHCSMLENELRLRGIDYTISSGASFFKRKEIEAILSYLRLIQDDGDSDAFDKIFKFRTYPIKFFPNRLYDEIQRFAIDKGLSLYEAFQDFGYDDYRHEQAVKKFVSAINSLRMTYTLSRSLSKVIDMIIDKFQFHEFIEDKYEGLEIEDRKESLSNLMKFIKGHTIESFLEYAYMSMDKPKEVKDTNTIQLMTIHKSKGLEFDTVFVIGVKDGKFPSDRGELIEEARLFYVAVTRAKNNLIINQISSYNQFILNYVGEDTNLYQIPYIK